MCFCCSNQHAACVFFILFLTCEEIACVSNLRGNVQTVGGSSMVWIQFGRRSWLGLDKVLSQKMAKAWYFLLLLKTHGLVILWWQASQHCVGPHLLQTGPQPSRCWHHEIFWRALVGFGTMMATADPKKSCRLWWGGGGGALDESESDLLTRPREVFLDLRNWRSSQYLKLIFSYFHYSRVCWIWLLEPEFAPYMHHKVLAAFDRLLTSSPLFLPWTTLDRHRSMQTGNTPKELWFWRCCDSVNELSWSLRFLMFPASNTSVFEDKTLICCVMYCRMRTSRLIVGWSFVCLSALWFSFTQLKWRNWNVVKEC